MADQPLAGQLEREARLLRRPVGPPGFQPASASASSIGVGDARQIAGDAEIVEEAGDPRRVVRSGLAEDQSRCSQFDITITALPTDGRGGELRMRPQRGFDHIHLGLSSSSRTTTWPAWRPSARTASPAR